MKQEEAIVPVIGNEVEYSGANFKQRGKITKVEHEETRTTIWVDFDHGEDEAFTFRHSKEENPPMPPH